MKEIEEFKPNELWEVSPEGFVPAGSVKKPPPPMVTHTAWSGSNYPQPYQKYVGDPPIPNISEPKEGDVVDFTVDTYEQEGKSSYLYTAKGSLTAGGSLVTVCFRTNRAIPKLIDRYGYATVHFRETVNLRERFFVKFKDIVWDEEEKVGEVVACNTCAEPVDKPGGGVVLHTGKMVCWACVNAFKKTHGSFSNLETMQ
jgi:hypothetical protein